MGLNYEIKIINSRQNPDNELYYFLFCFAITEIQGKG